MEKYSNSNIYFFVVRDLALAKWCSIFSMTLHGSHMYILFLSMLVKKYVWFNCIVLTSYNFHCIFPLILLHRIHRQMYFINERSRAGEPQTRLLGAFPCEPTMVVSWTRVLLDVAFITLQIESGDELLVSADILSCTCRRGVGVLVCMQFFYEHFLFISVYNEIIGNLWESGWNCRPTSFPPFQKNPYSSS